MTILLIAIDFDSTVYPLIPAAIEEGRKLGIDYPKHQTKWLPVNEIKYNTGVSITLEDLTNLYRKTHAVDVLKRYDPFPDASEVIQRLLQTNVEIRIVSDNHLQSYAPILRWLLDHKILSNYTAENFILTKDKRHWLREHRPEIVIDDRVRTILMARYELDATVLTLEHSWNVNLKDEAEGIHVCSNWLDIEMHLWTIIDKYMKGNVSK